MSLKILLYFKKWNDEDGNLLSWRAVSQNSDELTDNNVTKFGSDSDFIAYYKELVGEGEREKKRAKKIEVIGLLPGSSVTYTTVSVPTKNRKRLMQAIPFLVEDFIIGELDDMHINLGGYTKDEKIKVSVVDRNLIDQRLGIFKKNNILISRIYGITDIIHAGIDEAKIIFFEGQAIFKSNNFSIQTNEENIEYIFSSIPLNEVKLINIFLNQSEKIPAKISKKIKIEVESEGVSKVEVFNYSGSIFDKSDFFCDVSFKNCINLIEKSRYYGVGIYYDYAFLIGVTAVVLAFIQMALNFSSGLFFYKKASVTLNQGKAQYQKIFINEPVNDLQNQWENKLKKTISYTKEKSFSFVYFVVMTELLNNKKDSNGFKLNEFRFDVDSGNLRLNIEIGSIDFLDVLKSKLKENSIDMEILSANNEDNMIRALILVKSQ